MWRYRWLTLWLNSFVGIIFLLVYTSPVSQNNCEVHKADDMEKNVSTPYRFIQSCVQTFPHYFPAPEICIDWAVNFPLGNAITEKT
jgi:hypothetical protein